MCRSPILPVIAGALLGALASRPAAAQPVDGLDCVPVTTVHCTPRAQAAPPPVPAPVPQVDDPEVPPDVRAQCCAEPPPPPAPVSPTPVSVLPGGWHLVQVPGGTVLERHRRGVAGVWGPGLALWLTSFLGTTVGGLLDDGRVMAGIPFMGGFVQGGVDLADGKTLRGLTYPIGSIMQIGGFVMFLVGVSAKSDRIQRMPVTIAPMASRDGGGVSLSARF